MADRSPDSSDAGRLRELRRAAALGQALLKAKHDLNNLFHVAGGWSRLLRDPRTNLEQMQEGVDAVLTATQHVNHLIGGIFSLEGPASDALTLCDLAEKLSELARGLSLLLPSPDRLILEIHTRSLVLCNFSEVRGTLLDFVLELRDSLAADNLRLVLRETEHEPGHQGSRIVELHAARAPRDAATEVLPAQQVCLRFEAESGSRGARALERAWTPHARIPEAATSAALTAGRAIAVLLVDDHRDVRRLASMMLERAGYHVLTACDADEALDTSRNYDGPIQVLCCDAQMPGLPVTRLISEICAKRPDLKVLICTGEQPRAELNAHPHLAKPFSYQELISAVKDCHE